MANDMPLFESKVIIKEFRRKFFTLLVLMTIVMPLPLLSMHTPPILPFLILVVMAWGILAVSGYYLMTKLNVCITHNEVRFYNEIINLIIPIKTIDRAEMLRTQDQKQALILKTSKRHFTLYLEKPDEFLQALNKPQISVLNASSETRSQGQILKADPVPIVAHQTWLAQQVDTHLFFGPLARGFALGPLLLVVATLIALVALLGLINHASPRNIGKFLDKLIYLAVLIPLLKMQNRQVATMLWFATKSALSIGAIAFIVMGGLVGFQQGHADAWPNLFLGIVWLPGLEFIPALTPKQKYITLLRIALTIPCAYFGVQSGNWHW